MEAWQLVTIALGVICGLIGVIYYAGQSRDDKQDARFEKNEATVKEHIRDDILAHERLKAVETKVETLQTEVKTLRDMRHDIIEQVSHSLASWYTSILKEIQLMGEKFRK